MRFLVAISLALFVAPLGGASAFSSERIVVTVLDIEGEVTLVAWTPVAGAAGYEVFRGPSFDDLHLLSEVTISEYVDEKPKTGDVVYLIRSINTRTGGQTGSGGSCVERSGTTGVSVTTSSCA